MEPLPLDENNNNNNLDICCQCQQTPVAYKGGGNSTSVSKHLIHRHLLVMVKTEKNSHF